jgi:hypothetical protein
MTTNTEHRRRETDRVDQVCMKYQLEKANARIAELEGSLELCADAIYYLKGDNKEFDGLADKVFHSLPCNQEFIKWSREWREKQSKSEGAK